MQQRTKLPESFNATPRDIKGVTPHPDSFFGKDGNAMAPATHGFQVFKFRKGGQPFYDPDNGRSTHFLHPVTAKRYAEDHGLECIPLSATPSP